MTSGVAGTPDGPPLRTGRPGGSPARWSLPRLVVVHLVHRVGVLGYHALSDDEGTYAAQAWAVRQGELAHYTYWYDHPRWAVIQLGLLDWLPQSVLPGLQPVAASRIVLVAYVGVAAYLSWRLALRVGLGLVFGAVAVVLAYLSPLSVTLQRQVYLDNLATPWVLLAFVLVTDRRQRLWWSVGAGLAFGVAVLTKETTAVLLPLLCWAAYRYSHPRNRVFCLTGILAATGLAISVLPADGGAARRAAAGCGSRESARCACCSSSSTAAASGSVSQAAATQRRHQPAWLFDDPWLLGLAARPACLVCLASRRIRLVARRASSSSRCRCCPRAGRYLPAMYVMRWCPGPSARSHRRRCPAAGLDAAHVDAALHGVQQWSPGRPHRSRSAWGASSSPRRGPRG